MTPTNRNGVYIFCYLWNWSRTSKRLFKYRATKQRRPSRHIGSGMTSLSHWAYVGYRVHAGVSKQQILDADKSSHMTLFRRCVTAQKDLKSIN